MNNLLKISGFAVVLLLCAACNSKQETPSSGYSEYEKPDTVSSIQVMKDYHYRDTVEAGGVRYVYDIVREPNDSLPLVYGDDNDRYADNFIRLSVSHGNQKFFDKTFTKNSFRSYMESGFIKNAILEGMAFDCAQNKNLRFAVSVSYPASDIYIPLSITIAPDGSYNITKDEILDTIVEETTDTP